MGIPQMVPMEPKHVEITFRQVGGRYQFASADREIRVAHRELKEVRDRLVRFVGELIRKGASCRIEAYVPLGPALKPLRDAGAICRVGLHNEPIKAKSANASERLAAKFRDQARREPTGRLLAFDPTPAGLIGDRSLRKAFKNEWARIRKQHFKEKGLACELCKTVETAERLIHGHEVYSFPDPDTVKLERVLFICTRCHDVIHLERARAWCQRPYVQLIEDHYCNVNGGLTETELQQDYGATLQRSFAIREFYYGAAAKPKVDYGAYQTRVDESLRRRRNRPSTADDDDSNFDPFPDHECPWDVGKA
jgi:hypothetical protein